MEIYNKVVGETFIPREELNNFQGDLKDPHNTTEIKDLATRIRKKGFKFPIMVWHEHDNLILDGHQRLKALNELALVDFYFKDDLVPVMYIKAEHIEEAIETVFEANSTYSVMTEHGKEQFLAKADGTVDLEHIRGLNIKSINSDDLDDIDFDNINDNKSDRIKDNTKNVECPYCNKNFNL